MPFIILVVGIQRAHAVVFFVFCAKHVENERGIARSLNRLLELTVDFSNSKSRQPRPEACSTRRAHIPARLGSDHLAFVEVNLAIGDR